MWLHKNQVTRTLTIISTVPNELDLLVKEGVNVSAFVKVANQESVVVELKDLGLTENEIEQFQKTITCPRCGTDLQKIPCGGRWFAHLAKCDEKTQKTLKPNSRLPYRHGR